MRNARLDESQNGIKIARRNINNLRYADGTTLTAENKKELKSLLMKVKEESGNAGLKLNIKKLVSWHPSHHLMANRWANSGNSDRLFSWAPKSLWIVTAAMQLKDDCSLEEKLTNLESILKSRDITLLTNVHLVKTVVFPVVMYGCESWTIKKAEHQTIDAFELWCWRGLLRFPWTARRSNQSF